MSENARAMQIDILLHQKSQYGVIESFEQGLTEAFRKRGIAISEHFIDEDLPSALFSSSCDYTLGFNICLPEEFARVPHIVYAIDWVTYNPELFSKRHTMVCNVDKDSIQLLKALSACRTVFLPHAIAEGSILETENTRDLEILFAGTFIDAQALIEKLNTSLSRKLFVEVENLIEQSLFSTHQSHVHFLLKLLKDHPTYASEIQEKEMTFFDLCNTVEQIMRARDRMNLLQSIDREVHLYGNDIHAWKQALHGKKNCIFHKAVTFTDIMKLFQRTKIVLNSAPMFKQGLHERLLYALANGASVLTNHNALIPFYFSENRALAFFIAPHYQEINRKIDHLLQNEEKRIYDVKEAQKVIRSHHLWDHRVATLLEALEA